MELSSLLALPSGLEVADVSASDKLLTVRRQPHVHQAVPAPFALVQLHMFAVITPVS